MQINNLDINILYFLCDPIHGKDGDGTIRYEAVVGAFADIPEDNIRSAIHSMTREKLVDTDALQTRIRITQRGIQRLGGSIACRIHRFDHCRCGR